MESGYKPYARVAKPSRGGASRQSGAPHYGQLRKFTSGSTGERYPRSVLSFSNRHGKSRHPTQKPLPLVEWLVKTYSQPGDVVLDPFMGSGTTGVVCVRTGRRFIGIERDSGYFEVAQGRLEAAGAV